jgi:hypothetical protein
VTRARPLFPSAARRPRPRRSSPALYNDSSSPAPVDIMSTLDSERAEQELSALAAQSAFSPLPPASPPLRCYRHVSLAGLVYLKSPVRLRCISSLSTLCLRDAEQNRRNNQYHAGMASSLLSSVPLTPSSLFRLGCLLSLLSYVPLAASALFFFSDAYTSVFASPPAAALSQSSPRDRSSASHTSRFALSPHKVSSRINIDVYACSRSRALHDLTTRQRLVNQFSPIKYGTSKASARHHVLSIRAAVGAGADGRALHVRVSRAYAVCDPAARAAVCHGVTSACGGRRRTRVCGARGCGARCDLASPQLPGPALGPQGSVLGALGADGVQDLPRLLG